MVRLIVFSATGLLVGLVFGFAFFLVEGAILGAIICVTIGLSIAAYMNSNNVLDRPFFAQQDVDRIMRWIPYRLSGSGLPQETKDRIASAIRSTLESWL